ncbi:MAG: hypothetical protein M3Q23_13350 [Actinomycetota bacterium]|nr:hypothetical protein [Actinomycetota bacterium]
MHEELTGDELTGDELNAELAAEPRQVGSLVRSGALTWKVLRREKELECPHCGAGVSIAYDEPAGVSIDVTALPQVHVLAKQLAAQHQRRAVVERDEEGQMVALRIEPA